MLPNNVRKDLIKLLNGGHETLGQEKPLRRSLQGPSRDGSVASVSPASALPWLFLVGLLHLEEIPLLQSKMPWSFSPSFPLLPSQLSLLKK